VLVVPTCFALVVAPATYLGMSYVGALWPNGDGAPMDFVAV
jgi:hypothetical protein